MPGQEFRRRLKFEDKQSVVARGRRQRLRERWMYVGLIQTTKSRRNGEEITGAAYGMGPASVRPAYVDGTNDPLIGDKGDVRGKALSLWTMRLQLDEDHDLLEQTRRTTNRRRSGSCSSRSPAEGSTDGSTARSGSNRKRDNGGGAAPSGAPQAAAALAARGENAMPPEDHEVSSPEPGTSTRPRPHGAVPRGLDTTPSSSTRTGRFGRMFRRVPVFEHGSRDVLIALGQTMVRELETDGMLDKRFPPEDERRGREHGARWRTGRRCGFPPGTPTSGSSSTTTSRSIPCLEPHAPERPERADRLPHAALRSRLAVRRRAVDSALPLPARRKARTRRSSDVAADGARPAAQRRRTAR